MADSTGDCTSPGAVKRSRASRPKVKTGCLTCKTRRIKCDETKPSCLRCQKFGQQCDGYPKQPSSKTVTSNSSRRLIPKCSALEAGGCRSLPPISTIHQTLSKPLFQNGQEYHFFQLFCYQTSLQLSSYFDKELWTRLMLQACENSSPIRHAIIAIGALNLSTPFTSSSEVGTLRHQFAFRQYSKSICLLRRDVAGGRHDLRTTLISCLLFYCFESFHGYHDLAINQVYTGLRMIRDWTTSYYRPGRASSLKSQGQPMVEEDILRAFGSLEIQVMSYADGRDASVHDHYRHCGQASIDGMPTVFYDVKEARRLLEIIIRRSMHWLRSTMHLHDFPVSSPCSSLAMDAEDLDGPMNLFFDVDPSYEEQSVTLNEYERWDKAFRPLLNQARSRFANEETFLLASILRLHWLSGYLSIASNNCRNVLVNNGRFTRELEELVGIARILLQDASRGLEGAFVFDMQIIVPLMTVGWVYRHRALRREAVELLLRSPRKEGVWDGIVVGKIMSWLARIEEEGLDVGDDEEEYVPEWAAARCIKMGFDTEKKQAHVSCLQPVKGSPIGEELRRETIIPW